MSARQRWNGHSSARNFSAPLRNTLHVPVVHAASFMKSNHPAFGEHSLVPPDQSAHLECDESSSPFPAVDDTDEEPNVHTLLVAFFV